jgi:hypothetical protein
MKKFRVFSFFDYRDSYDMYGDLRVREALLDKDLLLFGSHLSFDESTTYKEMVRIFIQQGRLLPLDDPRLHYNIVLQAFEVYSQRGDSTPPRSISRPVIFREGQTLASTRLTHLIMNESEEYHLPRRELYCAISLEIREDSLPKQNPSSAPPRWDQIVNAFLTSLAANALTFTASVVSITTALIAVEKWWSKKHKASSQGHSSRQPESDIAAIRLLMTDGTQHRFEEWLTDPARLKHYIDIFNQPSSSIKPLQAIFVLKKDGPIIINVSEGTQNNLQLDELLSRLHIDSAEK